jgi:hypothetical protein
VVVVMVVVVMVVMVMMVMRALIVVDVAKGGLSVAGWDGVGVLSAARRRCYLSSITEGSSPCVVSWSVVSCRGCNV